MLKKNNLANIFANTFFYLGSLFSIIILFYCIYRLYYSGEINSFYLTFIVFFSFLSFLFIFGIKLKKELKVNFAVLFTTIIISFYFFEIYLSISNNQIYSYSNKTKFEIIRDLNNSGIETYPNIIPSYFFNKKETNFDTSKIFPLGGISKITTIFDNELGYYPIIKTDEHGFNNPQGLFSKNDIDIVLIGDSCTEGYSVRKDENIAAFLREADFNVINIGKAGNGPLLEFASLKEYGEYIKPKIVFWLYFPNDFMDLRNSEMHSSFLKKYLYEDNFTQNLILKQNEIDDLLKKYIKKNYKNESVVFNEKINLLKNHWLVKIIKFTNLRIRLSVINTRAGYNIDQFENEIVFFLKILEKSNTLVSSWGGKLYFVYLPSLLKYSDTYQDKFHESFFERINQQNIPIINTKKELFLKHPKPFSLFSNHINGHYNADGYNLIADTMINTLKNDGFIPLKSGD